MVAKAMNWLEKSSVTPIPLKNHGPWCYKWDGWAHGLDIFWWGEVKSILRCMLTTLQKAECKSHDQTPFILFQVVLFLWVLLPLFVWGDLYDGE